MHFFRYRAHRAILKVRSAPLKVAQFYFLAPTARRPGEEQPLRRLRAAPYGALPSLPPLLWSFSAAVGADAPKRRYLGGVAAPSGVARAGCVVGLFFQVSPFQPFKGQKRAVQKSRPYKA